MSAERAPATPSRGPLGGEDLRSGLVARDIAVTPPGAPGPVVSGVSVTVRSGEWVALAGPNGGGKTSVLLALAGLWPISAGTLRLDGAAFGPGAASHAGGGIAVVLQDPSCQILQSSVADEMAFAARNLGHAEAQVSAEVERWSRELGLEGELDQVPATLSAGRQQLVLLGAALASRPRLLLADEPTAHLDPVSRARVREAVSRAVADGMAVLWVSQDPAEWGAASRTVTVAGASPSRVGTSPASQPDAGPSAIKIEISPAEGVGRRIHVDSRSELTIGTCGVTAVLGPNGVGKSVLLAAVARITPSSQVRVEWSLQASHSPPIVALQYPELQIFEEVVAEEIAFAAVSRGRKRGEVLEHAANCLRTMGFDPERFMARRTWSLSTGEKRVVETVGALIAPSGLVVLDEPTAGLDADRRESLADLVADRAKVTPILLATQDYSWVERVGCRVFSLGPSPQPEPASPSRKRD